MFNINDIQIMPGKVLVLHDPSDHDLSVDLSSLPDRVLVVAGALALARLGRRYDAYDSQPLTDLEIMSALDLLRDLDLHPW